MGKAVADESKLALLHVLLDRIQSFLLGDLEEADQCWLTSEIDAGQCQCLRSGQGNLFTALGPRCLTHLHLRIGPSGDFHDHVEHRLLFIGIQRDIVERRQRHSILLDEDAVLQGIGRTVLPDGVHGRGPGVVAFLADG